MRKATLFICLLALASFSVAAVDYPIGSWADEIVYFFENDQSKVLDMMQSGDAHFFGNNFDADKNADILATGLPTDVSYGSYNDMLFNPAGPYLNSGMYNPLSNGKIRQAFRWLIDRDFLIDEYFFGLGAPMYGTFLPNCPTAGSIGPALRTIAITYSPDEAKGLAIIDEEMTAAGCEMVDGTWHYNGEEIVIVGLIRTEDERLQIGDYFADVWEAAGFAVDRHYGLNAELQAFWVSSDPMDGLWHWYTSGWIQNAIDRSESSNHLFFDTDQGYGIPVWQLFATRDNPETAEFYTLCEDFYYGNFADLEERAEMAAALEEWHSSSAVSYHIFLMVQAGRWAWAENVATTVGSVFGVSGNPFFARVARFVDEDGAPVVGGTILMADPGMFVEPWNPVDGSNWLYDAQIYNQTEDRGAYADPYTGLYFPWLIDHAAVEKDPSVIMYQSLDWVTLTDNDNIVPPADALYDFDPVTNEWTTIGDVYPDGTTARTTVTITLRDDLYENKWHDGSQVSFADFYFKFLLSASRPKVDSPYYDASTVAGYQTGLASNKGMKILDTDPIVIQFWDDLAYNDAEEHAYQFMYSFCPNWNYGTAPWHVMTAALLGEEKQEFAFSEAKATELDVDRVSFIAGPSLELLKVDAAEAATQNLVPFGGQLIQYMDPNEPFERYNNMIAFLEEYGHLWIGNGPMMITEVDTVARQIVISKFEDYQYTNEAFMQFAAPRYATISLDAPDILVAGEATTVTVDLTFQGEAYPMADISNVAWLIVDATNQVAANGNATLVSDGVAEITLSADVTAGLAEGSTTLEVVAVLVPVAMPSYGSATFLVTQ